MSVLPIVAIVLVLHLTVAPLDPTALYAFLIGSLLVVAGLTIFLFGIDQGLEPIGNFAGRVITRSNSYPTFNYGQFDTGLFHFFCGAGFAYFSKAGKSSNGRRV